MKVYTRTGDAGTTGILGGTRLPKNHIRIEAYGTVDELNAHLGMLRDYEATASYHAAIVAIQEDLFVLGSHLASDPEQNKMELPQLNPLRIDDLEQAMDAMDAQLPDIARCVCRRAELATIALAHTSFVNDVAIRYLNRLSDYLFVLSRALTHELGATETPWIPNKKR